MHTFILYLLSVIGSGCGFVTQMLVSGYWSATYSQDILYFSVNTAFYFLSLALGSLLTKFYLRPNERLLIIITLLSCAWAGTSIVFLKFAISHWENRIVIPILAVTISGLLAGQIIPLTVKLGEKKINLSTLFFLDYNAAIFFTLYFTLFLLIPYGYARTGLILAYSCLPLTAIGMVFLKIFDTPTLILLCLSTLVPYFTFEKIQFHTYAPMLSQSSIGDAKIIFSRQSHYQKIVFTEEEGGNPLFPGVPQHVLYLDGFVQFSSVDERVYHACLVNVGIAATEFSGFPVRNALILGGGDGLVARNLLNVSKVQSVTLVELDPDMIELAKTELKIRMYNLDSLHNPKVKVIIQDAFRWVRNTQAQYDLIVIDFPAPKNISLSRLFTAEFYHSVFKLLKPYGIVTIQAGPSYSKGDDSYMTLSLVPTSIKRSLNAIGKKAFIYANPNDSEAYILATHQANFDGASFFKKIGMFAEERTNHFCVYNPLWKEPEAKINTLNTLTLAYYMTDWFRDMGEIFFNYRGKHSVFLPD